MWCIGYNIAVFRCGGVVLIFIHGQATDRPRNGTLIFREDSSLPVMYMYQIVVVCAYVSYHGYDVPRAVIHTKSTCFVFATSELSFVWTLSFVFAHESRFFFVNQPE